MIIFPLLVLGLGSIQDTSPTLRWPLVPDSMFAINGVASGSAQLVHVLIASKTDIPKDEKTISENDPTNSFFALTNPGAPVKSLQISFMAAGDGTLLKFGGVTIIAKSGHLMFAKEKTPLEIATLRSDSQNDIQLVKHYDSLITYVNGKRVNQTITPSSPLIPIQIGMDGWTGAIIGVAGYGKALTEDEVIANQRSAQALAKSLLADTKTVTVEAQLTALTPVPELDRIAPYRSALVAEEYTIVEITKGRMSALKSGMKVRIFRWGLLAGKKTDVATAKVGDKATMLIQPLSADSKYEKEFQVDNLDNDISALYFVEPTVSK